MAGSLSGDELANGKALVPFLQRADELQKHDPLVAYYCRLYAMDKGLRVPSKDRSAAVNALLVSIMSRLEKDKAALQLSPDDGLHVEGFAQRVFSKADKQDRAGRADMGTAKTFYAAGIFFEVCRQFGELALEVEQKQRYAVWKAADIRRALADGRRPTPGPPGGDADATAAAPADAAATATAPAVAPPAAPSFPSADSLDAMFSGPPAPSTYGANAAPAAPGGVSAMGGSGRLQVARPVGGGTAAMQPNPHAQANPYHQGHGDYLQAPQGQAAQAAQAWQQSTAASDSAFITSFATAPAAPSSSLPTPPANSLVSPPTFTHWAPDSQYPSATPPSTANPAAPSAPSAPAAGGWAQPAAAAAAPPFQQPQAGAAAAAAAAAGAFTNPMFATPPAPNAAPGSAASATAPGASATAPGASATAPGPAFSFMPGGAAAASAGMGGAAGGTYGAHPSQASPHSEYGGGGGGLASGGGARAGHNVAAAANGSTAMASVSNCQGPGPREIADAHKAARYAVSALAGNDVPTAVDFIRKALALLEPAGGY